MRLRAWTAAEWLALAAAVLGAVVLAGYGFHSALLVQLQPGQNVAMVPATAASLMLAALALLALKRWQTVWALLLLGLNLAVLLENSLGLNLDLDWTHHPAWLQEQSVHPGRMSLPVNIGFLLFGVAILLLPRVQRRWAWIERWLTWLVVAASIFGIAGNVLRLDLLYRFHELTRTALHSGAGLLLLGLALWLSWRHRRWNRPPPGREHAARILAAARLALIVVIAVAALSALFMVQRMAERDAKADLVLRRQERASYVRLLLDQALEKGRDYARRPELTALLLAQPGTRPTAPPQGFNAIILERGRTTLLRLGTPIDNPDVQVPLPLGPAVDLIWNGTFYLRQQLRLAAAHAPDGTLTLEQPISLLRTIGVESASFGASGEVGLCGWLGAHSATAVCFPQRLHPSPYSLAAEVSGYTPPMRLALEGETGVADTIDYRGQRVLAAYAPVTGTGLGLVIKMDSRELYAPIRQQVEILGPLLILLAIIGLEMLRWQVRPLVEELVASRNLVATSEARFRAAAESGMDPFYIFESVRSQTTGSIASFRLIYANQPGEEFAGIEPGRGEVLGLSSVPQLESAGDVRTQFRQVVTSRQHWVSEFARPNGHGNNGPQWLSLQAVPLGDGVALTLRDISQRKWEEDRLRVMALTDALTGLANRDAFQKRLADAMANARRQRRSPLLAVLFLDVDHFKQINDTYGHAFGDMVLRAFAARLLRSVRSADTVARQGGDEFTILLENLDSTHDAERAITGIFAAMADPMHLDDHVVPVATSIGVAYYRGDATSANEMLQRADTALYEAKRSGRNVWRAYAG